MAEGGGAMFETLKEVVIPSRTRGEGNGPRTHGPRGRTWELINHRTCMRREGRLTQTEGRKLGRQIKTELKADRVERTRQVGEQLMVHLKAVRVREAWGTIWGWHKLVGQKVAKPCFHRFEDLTNEQEAIYSKVKPSRERIPCNANHTA